MRSIELRKQNEINGKIQFNDTILGCLKRNANDHPEITAFTFLASGEVHGEKESVTNRQFWLDVERLAQYLSLSGVHKDDVVLLLYLPGLDFIKAFFACMRLGCISAPLFPVRNNSSSQRIYNVWKDSGAKHILTIEKTIASQHKNIERSGFSDLIDQVNWIITDSTQYDNVENVDLPEAYRNFAYLQYTSGSTGTPKGVMVGHTNMIHNAALLSDRTGTSADSKALFWLPHFHDMGLIAGIVEPVYTGYPSTLFSPADFSVSPVKWIRAMSDLRATNSAGPNFALDQCLERIDTEQLEGVDLSSMVHIGNGAEPIIAESIVRFNEKFSKYGLAGSVVNPAYGLAEGTLIVTAGNSYDLPVIRYFDKSKSALNIIEEVAVEHPQAFPLVGCGSVSGEGYNIIIVDAETKKRLPEGGVGEIWIAGPSVTLGYWANEEATNEIFGHRIEGDDSVYLKTGDLGFIHEDQLYVSGRIKDVIIIKGQNFYPQDIEAFVSDHCVDVVKSGGAAFSHNEDGREALVIVQEISREAFRLDNAQKQIIADNIADSILNHFGFLPSDIVLISPKSLPKTSSGKIARSACKKAFLNQELTVVVSWNRTQTLIKNDIEHHIRLDQFDLEANIFEAGLSSFQLTAVSQLLSKRLRKQINLSDLYRLGSIAAVIDSLNDKVLQQEEINEQHESGYWDYILSKKTWERRLIETQKANDAKSFSISVTTELEAVLRKGFTVEELVIAALANVWSSDIEEPASFLLKSVKSPWLDSQQDGSLFPLVIGKGELPDQVQQAEKQICNISGSEVIIDKELVFDFYISREAGTDQPNARYRVDIEALPDCWNFSIEASEAGGIDLPTLETLFTETIGQLVDTLYTENESPWYSTNIELSKKFPDTKAQFADYPLTDIQNAYIIGRDHSIELGGIGIVNYLEFDSDFEISRFEKAVNEVIKKHPALRTIFSTDKTQRVLEIVPEYRLLVHDISTLSEDARENYISGYRKELAAQDFKLDQWPLFKIEAIKTDAEKHRLVFYYDLMISDAGSTLIWLNDCANHYLGKPFKIPATEYTFRDYYMEDHKPVNNASYEKDKAYWTAQLPDFPSAPRLPLKQDLSRAGIPEFEVKRSEINGSQWNAIKQLAKEKRVLPVTLLTTAFAELLQFWSNSDRFAINLTIVERKPYHADVRYLTGEFTSNLLLDVDFNGTSGYFDKADKLQNKLIESLEHRSYSGVKFIEDIINAHGLHGKAVMPVVLTAVLSSSDQLDYSFTQLGELVHNYSRTPQVMIDLQVIEIEGKLEINLGFVQQLFEADFIASLLHTYIQNLSELAETGAIQEISVNESDLQAWELYNSTSEEIPVTTLYDLVMDQFARTPGNSALIDGEEVWTYQELYKAALKVSEELKSRGVGNGDAVSIIGNRNNTTIANLIGVVLTGALYVPIDPEYPEERKAYIVKNSKSCFILEDLQVIPVENTAGHGLQRKVSPEDIAYIIYTSGSTGYPKGVIISNQAVCNTILDINQRFKVSQEDRILGISSLGFDLSVYDVFGAFASGAALVIAKNQRDVANLIQLVNDKHITVWNSVPAIMDSALKTQEIAPGNTSLRLVMFSGDWIPLSLPERTVSVFESCEVISLGGATEASIWSISYPVKNTDDDWKSIPYGYPLANQQYYVLNDQLKLVPPGVEGELFIGGVGVAECYSDLEEVTRKAFIQHPAYGKLFRTGDYGKLNPKGYIEFLGRKDTQVKVLGFRIELSEIELAVRKIGGIEDAIILISEIEGEKQIVAYLVGAAVPDGRSIRKVLTDHLPYYMIPRFFIQIDKFPLTANGKIDRKSLPEPSLSVAEKQADDVDFSETQIRVKALCEEVLGVESIGMADNVFELGATSIHATQIALKASLLFKAEIKLTDIFRAVDIEDLAAVIDSKKQGSLETIQKLEEADLYAVSPGQTRIWFEEELLSDEFRKYNESKVFELRGQFDPTAFISAFNKVIMRYEIFHTAYVYEKEGLYQRLVEPQPLNIEVEEMADTPENLASACKALFSPKFDLEGGESIRMKLLKAADDKFYFLVVIHHIATDGWSMAIILDEAIQVYNSLIENKEISLNNLSVQYKDYAAWQIEKLRSEDVQRSRIFWKEKLSGKIPVLNLPVKNARSEAGQFEGEESRFTVTAGIKRKLEQIAQENETTLFAVLMTIFKVALYRHTSQSELIVGTTLSGREHPQLENNIGFFLNTLPVRSQLDPDDSFTDNLAVVKEELIKVLEHQDYPIDSIVSELDFERVATRNPLFDVLLVLQPKARIRDFQKVQFKEISNPFPVSKFDLTLDFTHIGDIFEAVLTYKKQLFSHHWINAFTLHVQELMERIAASDQSPIAILPMLTEPEREEIIVAWNDTASAYPEGLTLVDLYDQRAEENGDKIILKHHEGTLTFRQFDEKVNHWAQVLSAQYNKGMNKFVGVQLDRSPEQVIALMAVLKSGGTYIPLSTDYPEDRVQQIINDAQIDIIIAEKAVASSYSADITFIDLTSDNVFEKAEVHNAEASDLAYIIYTSGSTGKPKGVMLSHAGVVNRLHWQDKQVAYTDQDVILQKTPFTFDVSVWEYFIPLCFNGSLALAQNEKVLSPQQLMEDIERFSVTNMHFVPTMFNQFLAAIPSGRKYDLSSVRCIITSGEALSPEAARRSFELMPHIELLNLYGPTEASVDVSYQYIDKDAVTIPIGKPIQNISLYVLSDQDQVQPAGVVGEICIAGIGVAQGYLNRPDLTSEKFRENPYSKGAADKVLYRTGDLGYWSESGVLHYITRKDNQVKLRGFRIELGEIESVLAQEFNLDDVAVLVQNIRENPTLVAYLKTTEALSPETVKNQLSRKLPSYMVPSFIVTLEEFPLTSSGKLDRKALPVVSPDEISGKREMILPVSEKAVAIAHTWKKVLGAKEVSLNDDFFELGGDSIKAMQVVRMLSVQGWKLSLKDLMYTSKLSDLELKIETNSLETVETYPSSSYLSPVEQWFFENEFHAAQFWNQAVKLKKTGGFDLSKVIAVFEHIIGKHEQLRTVFVRDGAQISRKAISAGSAFVVYDAIPHIAPESLLEIQQQGDLSEGKLIKIVPVLTAEQPEEIVIFMHHLLTDGVSWRIILEEFEALYEGHGQPEDNKKTLSFAQWLNQLEQEENQQENRTYWEYVLGSEKYPQIPVAGNSNKTRDFKVQKFELFIDNEQLLKSGFAVNELLLAVYSNALLDVFGLQKYLVLVEGHGRFETNRKLDLSQTVGWFTSLFGVSVSAKETVELLSDIQRQLKLLPEEGQSYLAFKNEFEAVIPAQQVCFNYLGEYAGENASFEAEFLPVNMLSHPESERPFAIELIARKEKGNVNIELHYGSLLFDEAIIAKLQENIRKGFEALSEIIFRKQLKSWYQLSADDFRPVVPDTRNSHEEFPLTDVQMSYLLGKEMGFELGGTSTVNYFEFNTTLDIDRLSGALNELIVKHPMLRTVILNNGMQQVLPEVAQFHITHEDLTGIGPEATENRIGRDREKFKDRNFETDTWPLFDFKAFTIDENTSRLLICYDLMVIDGGSTFILLSDLLNHYNQEPYKIPATDFTFRDYRMNLLKMESGDQYAKDRDYWRAKLEDFPEAPELPFRKDPSRVQKPEFKVKELIVDSSKWHTLKETVKHEKVSITSVLLSLFAESVAFWTNSNHFALNLTVADRMEIHPDVNYLIGEFTSTLLLEVDFRDRSDFWKKVKSVQEKLVEALEHRSYSGVKVIQDLIQMNNIKGKALMPIVFTSVLNENDRFSNIESFGEQVQVHTRSSQVAIDMQVIERKGELQVLMGYVDQIFDHEMITALFDAFTSRILSLENNKQPEPIRIPESSLKLWDSYNQTKQDFPEETLVSLLDKAARLYPDSIAIESDNEQLTYADLNERSNQLANYLIGKGVEKGAYIAVIGNRIPVTYIHILGVLKAGAAYVPIDPEYPESRVNQVINIASCQWILDEHFMQRSNIQEQSNQAPKVDISENDVAYAIFTSGSTGQPKGVVIQHGPVANTIQDINNSYGISSGDAVLGISSLSFDLSVYDFFGPLAVGGKLVLINDQRNISEIAQKVIDYNITVWNSVPAIMDLVADELVAKDQENKPLYWSPFIAWDTAGGKSIIADKHYDITHELIEEIYALARKGATRIRLQEAIEQHIADKSNDLLNQLIRENVLTYRQNDYRKVFKEVKDLYDHFDKKILYDEVTYRLFKTNQLNRGLNIEGISGHLLAVNKDWLKPLASRRSARVYNEKTMLDARFEALFSALKSREGIGVYLAIKPNRVIGYEEGIYRFSSEHGRLKKLSNKQLLSAAFNQQNRDIFETAAFTVFFISSTDADQNERLLLQAGEMSGELMWQAESHGISTCYIGMIDEEAVRKAIHLKADTEILTVMTGGIVDQFENEASEERFELQIRRSDTPDFSEKLSNPEDKRICWNPGISWYAKGEEIVLDANPAEVFDKKPFMKLFALLQKARKKDEVLNELTQEDNRFFDKLVDLGVIIHEFSAHTLSLIHI